MDGVIADVSLSYRQAIIDTAKAYSAEVKHEHINEAKAAGNANNDWILSHRLIANYHARTATGYEAPSLDAVTQTFESIPATYLYVLYSMTHKDIYQGVPGKAGLRELEKLLISLEQFEAFNQHLPLAIVTGRPRSDAIKFLQLHHLEHLFKYVVSFGVYFFKMEMEKYDIKKDMHGGCTSKAIARASEVGIG
jgi:HAD superfamily hydrolase (TIGR01548 family)